jgi:alpha-methylacyl-CoA racemase
MNFNHQKPLQGIRVLEFEGLAPSVYAGMVDQYYYIWEILADFGADVIIINKSERNPIVPDTHETILNRNKKSIIIDLKNP